MQSAAVRTHSHGSIADEPIAAAALAEAAPARAGRELRRRWTRGLDSAIGRIVEPVAAALVVFEVIILGAEVYTRYAMDNAIVWADDLAGTLFLWLTMLGAVAAYRRGEHLGFSALVRRMSPRAAEICDVIATMLVAVFSLEVLAAVTWPAVIPKTSGLGSLVASIVTGKFFAASYLGQESTDMSPALQMPRSYVVLGIVVGLLFMLILALLRLVDRPLRTVLPVVVATIAVGAAAYLGRSGLAELGNFNLILFFVLFLGGEIAIGVPIAFAFGIATLSYLGLATSVPLSVIAGQMDEGMTDLVLLAIPLFVLLGLLIDATGIARRLVEAIAAFVGHLKGGLNIVLVAAMFLVSGISGSKLADMAAVTPVLFPEMERRGHDRGQMIALLSTSGAMAELIPPSLVLIIVGTVCNLSIAALFTGGLLPAAVAALALIMAALFRSRGDDETVAKRMGFAERFKALFVAIPGLLLPFLIRYCVVAGIATATEVSTVGVIYSFAVGTLVYRELDWRRIYPMLRETASLAGAIMLIIAMATAMGWALTQSGFAANLAAALATAPGGRIGFIAVSTVLFIVLGAVLEGIPAIVLFGPLLFPVAQHLGIHQIHYAIIAILAMSIGLFTPPFGVGYYGACAVGKCDPDKAAIAILPYLAALLAALVVIAAVPWLSTGFL
jgi:tripartite ATP-independent transporter DctM subunit